MDTDDRILEIIEQELAKEDDYFANRYNPFELLRPTPLLDETIERDKYNPPRVKQGTYPRLQGIAFEGLFYNNNHIGRGFGAVGDRGRIEQILRKNIKYLGKKRSYGKGKVIDIKVEIIDNDYSMIKDGCANRWLPDKNGTRFVRIRPPYWNRIDRVNCCEVGDGYKYNK